MAAGPMHAAEQGAGAQSGRTTNRWILATLFLVTFIDLAGFGMVLPLLPRYGEMYGPSSTVLGLFMSTYSFFQFLFAPILGRLSDRVGRRPVMLLSLFGAAVGHLLLGVAGSMPMLFASRVIAGASAGNIAAAQAVIADVTGPEGRAKGMGVLGAAFGLGFIVGPAVGGVLFGVAQWLPGIAACATSLVAVGMAYWLLPETHGRAAQELRSRAPIDLKSLRVALAHPFVGLLLAAFFLAVFGFANFESSFVFYCEQRFALTAQATGWLFLFFGLVSALVQGLLIGPLTRIFGEPRLAGAGMLISSLSLASLPYFGAMPLFVTDVGLIALGVGAVNPTLPSLISRVVDPDEVGGVLGVYQSVGSLARIVGPFVGVVAFEDLGHAWPFRIASLMMLGAAGLTLVLWLRLRAERTLSSTESAAAGL